MGKELKVLMMGGQRVGKSSALAAIMDSFVTGPVSCLLTAKDKTVLVKKEGVEQASIQSKLEDVKRLLQDHVGKTILVNSGKTNTQWDYRLELSIPQKNETMTIVFTDVNGEFFDGGKQEQEGIIELVKSYDVFIVAIDTPFMMESLRNDLVDSVVNHKYNCIDSIHTCLTQIDDNDGNNAKLVIFAPIKCEKWAKENQLDTVTRYVQEDYKTTLTALSKYKRVQVEIIPIQTIGTVVFQEHREAYRFRWTKRQWLFFKKECQSSCAVLDNGRVRLSDGTEMDPAVGEILDDPSVVLIPNTDIVRPNSWFKVLTKAYKPHNCEQLAFHILDFMLSKLIDLQIQQEENHRTLNGFLNFVTIGLWKTLRNVFGGISLQQMSAIVERMYDLNLIKKSGEGIRILNECNFKKVQL